MIPSTTSTPSSVDDGAGVVCACVDVAVFVIMVYVVVGWIVYVDGAGVAGVAVGCVVVTMRVGVVIDVVIVGICVGTGVARVGGVVGVSGYDVDAGGFGIGVWLCRWS